MTPPANPQTRQEHSYNRRHTVTRAVIERTIRVLKARWVCLDTAGGKLLYTPEKVCQIILACCVLHNIAVKEGIVLPDPAPAEDMPDDIPHGVDHQDAILIRQQLIAQLWGIVLLFSHNSYPHEKRNTRSTVDLSEQFYCTNNLNTKNKKAGHLSLPPCSDLLILWRLSAICPSVVQILFRHVKMSSWFFRTASDITCIRGTRREPGASEGPGCAPPDGPGCDGGTESFSE